MHYTLYHRLISLNISATMWWIFFDTDMQTSTNKYRRQAEFHCRCCVYMHSGVIEGGRVCGHGSTGGRLMEGFQGASLLETRMRNQCADFSAVYASCNPGAYTAAISPYEQSQKHRRASICLHQLIHAHAPTCLQSCQNACALHLQ